jgi:peptidoglycan/xylan/chitin deacetylase (PgdA/CDA1 family)
MTVSSETPTPVRRLAGRTSRVYLTFDDGPDPEWTPRFLDVLEEAGVRATFFVVGRTARRYRTLLRHVAAAGHAIGNHTYAHRHPWAMTPSEARREVANGSAAIADVLGQAPRLFRPPHGRLRPTMTEAATEHGQRTVLWSLSACDWGPFARASRIQSRLSRIRAGDIVLMHDGRNRSNHPWETLHALPSLLGNLQETGLEASAIPARGGIGSVRSP